MKNILKNNYYRNTKCINLGYLCKPHQIFNTSLYKVLVMINF